MGWTEISKQQNVTHVPEYKISKSPSSQTYVNRIFTIQKLWAFTVFQDGVRPGLVISVVGLARQSLDFRLVRDL